MFASKCLLIFVRYLLWFTAAAKKKGMSENMLNELIAIVGMANETNRLVESYQVEVDKFLK